MNFEYTCMFKGLQKNLLSLMLKYATCSDVKDHMNDYYEKFDNKKI